MTFTISRFPQNGPLPQRRRTPGVAWTPWFGWGRLAGLWVDCPLSAPPTYPCARLLDHLVRKVEQVRGQRQAKGPRRLQIDHELQLHRLLPRRVGGRGTLQDLVHVERGPSVPVAEVRAIRPEAACFDGLTPIQPTTMSAPARCFVMATRAPSNSSGPCTPTGYISIPNDRAAPSISYSSAARPGRISFFPDAWRRSKVRCCPSTPPRSRSAFASVSAVVSEDDPVERDGDSSERSPTRATFPAGCAAAASSTASRLRMRVTMDPTALYHIVVSSHRPHANLLLSLKAERHGSGAGNSRSDVGAEAISSRLHAIDTY